MSKCNIFPALLALTLFSSIPLAARADVYDRGMDAYQSGDYAHALGLWKTLADNEHAQASYNLGFIYEFGYGVAPRDMEAFNYYLRAAQLGHIQAQHTVAWMYQLGKGVTANLAQAAHWASISAHSSGSENETDALTFMEQLQSELKNAGARYDVQKAKQHHPLLKPEAIKYHDLLH